MRLGCSSRNRARSSILDVIPYSSPCFFAIGFQSALLFVFFTGGFFLAVGPLFTAGEAFLIASSARSFQTQRLVP